MSATNLQPIFDYIDEVKKEMSTKEDIAKVLSAIDAFALNNKNNYKSI